MRRFIFLGLGALALALLAPGQAKALPELQLYLEGATYDTTTETWVLSSPGPLRLWVLGDVGDKGTISNVNLAIAYSSTLYWNVSFTLTPSTTGGLGGFTDPSTPGTPTFSQEQNGTTPKLSDGKNLPSHDIYGTGTAWSEFHLGNFDKTDSPLADFSGSFPSPTSEMGQINVYDVSATVSDPNFTGPLALHFDAYNSVQAGQKSKAIFAPFSHDGEGTITGTPEPSTMAIAGLGMLGFVGFGLRRRLKK